MEEGIAEVQYKESEKEEGSCGRRDSLQVSIRHSGQRHTAHGAEERPRRGGISETGPDWGATLVHVSGCARARAIHAIILHCWPRMHCRRLR